MCEFDDLLRRWVADHRAELLGLDCAVAAAAVEAAGFRAAVKIPRPGLAFAAAYWGNTVSLWCTDGIVREVEPG